MLIVEGPDGGGKTTLAQELSERLGWPIAERVVASDTTIQESLKPWVEENVLKGFHHTIYDRHRLISEPIYGPLFRNELQDGFDQRAWHYLQWLRFRRCEPIVIVCMPPLKVVLDTVRNDPENQTVSAQIAQVWYQYWTFLCRRELEYTFHYDYTFDLSTWTVDQFAHLVRERVARREPVR